jgi:hypothetical protein
MGNGRIGNLAKWGMGLGEMGIGQNVIGRDGNWERCDERFGIGRNGNWARWGLTFNRPYTTFYFISTKPD